LAHITWTVCSMSPEEETTFPVREGGVDMDSVRQLSTKLS
jgi:hypothetical protein